VATAVVRPAEYSATASLLFRDPGLDQKLFGSTFLAPSRDPNRESETNVRLVSLETVAARAARKLGGGIDGAAVEAKTQIHAQGQSDVVAVTATDRDPAMAAKIANLVATEYIAFRRDADRAKVAEAEGLVRGELKTLSRDDLRGERGRALESRLEELETLASLQTGNAELAQAAAPPTAPSAPRPVRSGILGVLAGAMLAVLLVLASERMDRRLRSIDEIEQIFRLPVLAAVPRSRALPDVRNPQLLGGAEVEAFRALRANLRYFNAEREIRSLVITSAQPGDGKSTTAWNLAVVSAQAGTRTLLIEADLRRPSLAGTFPGISTGRGVTDVLAAGRDLAECVAHVAIDRNGDQSDRVMDVLFAGRLPPNPTDLLDSQGMRGLLARATESYDLVILDTPPTTLVADAVPLMTMVAGVIVITRLKLTTRGAARRLERQLTNLGAPVLGVVVNFSQPDARDGYYGYYGRTHPDALVADAPAEIEVSANSH
jgi:capsular exopolysaccharide synthesis family protein